jgi:hypothetical protein
MKRRQFIHTAAAAALFSAVAWARMGAGAGAGSAQRRHYVFFDDRFQRARRAAASWSTWNRPIGVQADVTPLWRNGLDRVTREHPFQLHGVTTTSFLFSLKILVAEHASLEIQESRLDRDLLLWTMRTTPKPDYGTTPWPTLYPRV